MFGDGIFTQEGEAWRHSRNLLKPQLVHKVYESLNIFKQPIEDLLQVFPEKGGIVDLQPLFFRYTLDVTSAFLFGESTYTLRDSKSSTKDNFASAFDTAQQWVVNRFRLLDLYWLIGGKEFREACERVHNFADQIIDRNLDPYPMDKTGSHETFLQSVARDCPDRAALRGQIINILAAGRDTMACLLSWTL